MPNRTPPKPPFKANNNAPDHTARQLVFLTDEEDDVLTNFFNFIFTIINRAINRGLDSLSASLKYGLPITLEGSIAAHFIRNNVNNTLQDALGAHTLAVTQDFGAPQALFYTPSNQRQITVLHKDPSTLQLTRYSYTLPDLPDDIDPDEVIPGEGFTFTTTQTQQEK